MCLVLPISSAGDKLRFWQWRQSPRNRSVEKRKTFRGYLNFGIDQRGIMHDLFRSYASLSPGERGGWIG
jgi:hypothetical protein